MSKICMGTYSAIITGCGNADQLLNAVGCSINLHFLQCWELLAKLLSMHLPDRLVFSDFV